MIDPKAGIAADIILQLIQNHGHIAAWDIDELGYRLGASSPVSLVPPERQGLYLLALLVRAAAPKS